VNDVAHVSFFQYQAVLHAGVLQINSHGILRHTKQESGHYQPTSQHAYHFYLYLHEELVHRIKI
jgi:hypothetical protein